MKKLALLLTALGLVSAAAYAAPELTVTSVGQELEMEHELGTDGTDIWLWNSVGLAYGDDWTFGLLAGKMWNYNDKNDDVKSADHRLQLDAWKKINDDLKLGFRYRGHENYDRFYVRYNYSHGMFVSEGDFWYQFNQNEDDTVHNPDQLRFEWHPLGVKLGPVTAKYYVEYAGTVGGTVEGEEESYIEHQLRVTAPLYKWDRLSLSTEARITLHHEKDFNGTVKHQVYEDFGRNRIYLKANYAVSENLNVYANYYYELREREAKDGYLERDVNNADLQNLVLGWSYTF